MRGVFERDGHWWVSYFHQGKRIRQRVTWQRLKDAHVSIAKNCKLEEPGKELAVKLYEVLRADNNRTDRQLSIDAGKPARVSELFSLIEADYTRRGLKSLDTIKFRWEANLKPVFGATWANSIKSADLDRYVTKRREAGASAGTINREVAVLRRMLKLGHESDPPLVARVPKFQKLKESDPRSGFVEDANYRKLKNVAGELWLRAMLATGYTFGFRKGELLELRVSQVDLLHRTITLNPGSTKNDEGRTVVMTAEVLALITMCVQGKQADQFVFTRTQKSGGILDFRRAWELLTTKAGLSGLLFHDLRRSAVRNAVRRGVSESVAMKISGHRSRSVFERYNVTALSDLERAARLIEAGAQVAPDSAPCGTESGTEAEAKEVAVEVRH